MKNKYFSQHNLRNTRDASNPTGNTVPLKNILGTIIGETLMMLQNPTGNTVPLKNILGTNNWRNTRDASNPTGNTVLLKIF